MASEAANVTEAEKPTFVKTKDIFEKIVGRKLKLQWAGNQVCFNDGKTIVLPEAKFPGLETTRDRYTLEEHELAHIVYGSSADMMREFVEAFKYYPSIARNVYNIVEDMRIESCWSATGYVGSTEDFKSLRSRAVMTVKAENALEVLFAARAGRPDLVSKSQMKLYTKFLNEFKKVERTSIAATFVVSKRIMNVIVKSLKEQRRQEQEQKQSEQQGQQEQKGENGPSQRSGEQSEESEEEKSGESGNGQNEEEGEEEGKESSQGSESSQNESGEGSKSERESPEAEPSGLDKKVGDFSETQSITPEEAKLLQSLDKDARASSVENGGLFEELGQLVESVSGNERKLEKNFLQMTEEEVLEKAAELMETEIEKVSEALEVEEPAPPVDPVKLVSGKVITQDIFGTVRRFRNEQAIRSLATGIRKALSQIRGKAAYSEDYEGTDLSLEGVVQHRVRKDHTEIFMNEADINLGLNICCLLDLSGSMQSCDLVGKATTIFAGVLDGISGLRNVDVEVYGFSGDEDDAFVTPIVKLTRERVRDIDVSDNREYRYTNTWHAVEYITAIMQRKEGRKLLIIVTDGSPESPQFDSNEEISTTAKAVSEARSKGVEVFTIRVGRLGKNIDTMGQMFGKEGRWVIVDDFTQAGTFIISAVLRQFARTVFA